jgi:hypothetical protein
MERSDGVRLCGAVGKRAGAASDLIGAQSLTETKGECARDTLSRVCRKVSAVALPATAPAIRRKRFLANRRFSMRSTGVLLVGWTDGN